jgi:hypothetical protein
MDKEKNSTEEQVREDSKPSYDRYSTFEDHHDHKWYFQTRNAIYYVLGVIEVMLAFRLVFKLLGASTTSPFVNFLYYVTKPFIMAFAGIFETLSEKVTATQFVLEPATIIAMIVYAVIARGLVSLVKLKLSGSSRN